ncbi:hypothetical protein EVAR_75658_1 [Eumeta japonica]|uniref:Uncharacterized protein n=1 Tax=Eumeta variegata TaxID=151549 RepID=A0A4C1U1H9_EUMVA|nr:hypothetical protein EVAR_75658_1 [Eumeta japonica]
MKDEVICDSDVYSKIYIYVSSRSTFYDLECTREQYKGKLGAEGRGGPAAAVRKINSAYNYIPITSPRNMADADSTVGPTVCPFICCHRDARRMDIPNRRTHGQTNGLYLLNYDRNVIKKNLIHNSINVTYTKRSLLECASIERRTFYDLSALKDRTFEFPPRPNPGQGLLRRPLLPMRPRPTALRDVRGTKVYNNRYCANTSNIYLITIHEIQLADRQRESGGLEKGSR